jgi:hypothetical protein
VLWCGLDTCDSHVKLHIFVVPLTLLSQTLATFCYSNTARQSPPKRSQQAASSAFSFPPTHCCYFLSLLFPFFSSFLLPILPSLPLPFLLSHKQSTRGEISLIEDAKEAGLVLRTYIQKLAERAPTPLGVVLRVAPRSSIKGTQGGQVGLLTCNLYSKVNVLFNVGYVCLQCVFYAVLKNALRSVSDTVPVCNLCGLQRHYRHGSYSSALHNLHQHDTYSLLPLHLINTHKHTYIHTYRHTPLTHIHIYTHAHLH